MNKSHELFEKLNTHWQIVVFITILLGYITFSFYMNLNGFSFIEIDIKQIVGFGLLSGIFILLIIFASVFNFSFLDIVIFSSIPIFVLNALNGFNSILIVLLTLIAVLFITFVFLDIHTEEYKNEILNEKPTTNKAKKFYDWLFIPMFPILLAINFHWSYLLLFFVNMTFLFSFQRFYSFKKYFNPMVLITFILIIPFVLAMIINEVGLKVVNFEKKNILFKTNGNDINGTMVYQNTNSIFLHELNKTIEIKKADINSEIVYSEYAYKRGTLLDLYSQYSSMNLDKNITKPSSQ